MWRTVWSSQHLVLALIRRQYALRYRQSFIGFAWGIIPPLATLGVASILFDRVMSVDSKGSSYPVFAMAALVPWTFFANGISLGVPSIVQSPQLVGRLAFPRAALPLSAIGTSMIDLGVAGLIFIAFAYTLGDGLPLMALWTFALIVIELALIVGIVLFGAALNVFARDIRMAVPLALQFWLFLTPVMYPLSSVPAALRTWYLANPMTGIVESFRSVLVEGHSPATSSLVSAGVGALVCLIIGSWYFRATEPRFADAL